MQTHVLAAGTGATAPPVAKVFLAVVGVIAVARLLGWLVRKAGQPPVVGEILAGLLLGASLLGQVDVGGEPATELLFPATTVPYLEVLANLGLVVFMFIVGMELDLGLMKGNERRALLVSVSSVALPLALGGALALLLHAAHDVVQTPDGPVPVDRTAFVLFLGASMSVTAFPVLARILTERRMQGTPLGVIALAAAAVDDVLAWSLLAVVSAVAAQASAAAGDVPPIEVVLPCSVLYIGVMLTAGRRLLARLVAVYERAGRLTPDLLAVLLVGLLLSAWTTDLIGIHFIFGAFVFGACLPRQGTQELFREVLERLEQMSVVLLLPVFFIVTGLAVDVTTFEAATFGELALVLLVAVSSKFGGAYLAGRLLGIPNRRAAALGLLMNTRGLTELVLLSVGRSLGVLDDQMFSMLVVMALVTTFMTAPLLRLVYPERVLLREIADAERAGAGEPDVRRVLVVLPDGAPAVGLVDTALDLVGDESPAELVLVRFREQRRAPLELGSGLPEDLASVTAALEQIRDLEHRARARGVRAVAQVRASDDHTRDVGLLVDAHAVDLVVVPEDTTTVDVPRLVQAVDATVVVHRPGRAGTTVAGAPVLLLVEELGSDAVVALAVRAALASGSRLHVVTGTGRRRDGRRLEQLQRRLTGAGLAVTAGPVPQDAPGRLAVSAAADADLPASVRVHVVGQPTRIDAELDQVLGVRSLRSAVPVQLPAGPATVDLTAFDEVQRRS